MTGDDPAVGVKKLIVRMDADTLLVKASAPGNRYFQEASHGLIFAMAGTRLLLVASFWVLWLARGVHLVVVRLMGLDVSFFSFLSKASYILAKLIC
jgi:hypothetical protein